MESEDVKKEETVPAKKESAISVNKELLNQKLTALMEKNKALMEKVKSQADKIKEQAGKIKEQALALAGRAGNSKVAVAGKSLVGKIKGLFTRVQVVPKKQILAFHLGGEIGYLRGYIFHSKATGCVVVREASLVSYELGGDQFEVIRDAGNPTVCRENVVYICDAPDLA